MNCPSLTVSSSARSNDVIKGTDDVTRGTDGQNGNPIGLTE